MALAWFRHCFSCKQVERIKSGSCGDQAICRRPEVTVAIGEAALVVLKGFLQRALCNASQEKLAECRAKALVRCLRYHLDEKSPVVRLYGLAEDGIGKPAFVLLASAADIERHEDDRPGSYITFAPASKDAEGRTQMQNMLNEALSTKMAVTSISPDTSAVCVALPLLLGDVIISILWIQHQPAPPVAATTAENASATDPVRRDGVLCTAPGAGVGADGCLLRSPLVLQQLALSAPVILAAGLPDAPDYFNLLSSALRRLADCMTLKALVAELCGILVAHVRRNFLLDASIRAALVPVAGSHLAFLLEENAQSVRNACGGVGAGLVSATVAPTQGPVALAAATLFANASCDTATATIVGAGDSVCGGRNATSGSNLTYSGPQAITAAKLDAFGSKGRRGSCYEGTPMLGHAVGSPAGGRVRGTAPHGVRRSSSEMNLAKAAARTPSLQPLRRPTGHAGVVLPDTPPTSCRGRAHKCCMANGSSQAGRMLLAGTSNAVGGCGTGTEGGVASAVFNSVIALAALRAKPFRMSETILQQMVMQGSALERGDGNGNTCGGGDRYRGSGVLTGEVVPDCLQYVQSLRLPSRDVYMLLNAAAVREPTTVGTLYDSCGSPSSSTRSRMPALGLATATTGGSTGGGASASPFVTAKSLTIVGVATEDDAVLGMYVSFPFSLPPHMLEAIRNSCADLLAAVLAPMLRHKLREQCASELETLAAGVPGSYVIVPSGKAPTVPRTMTGLQASTLGILNLTNGDPNAIANTTGGGGGGGSASVDGSSSLGQPAQQSQPQPAGGEQDPSSPVVSETLVGLVQPHVNHAGARMVGMLGASTGPPPAVSVRTSHRHSSIASPARTFSARQRLLCLWEGSGDTSSQVVSSGGGGLGQTASGVSRCGGPTSVLGMAASVSLAASGVSLLRRNTGPTEQLHGPMEMLSNDAALLTLLEADCEGTARVQLSVLVESIMSTLRDSTMTPGVEDLYDMISFESRSRGVLRPFSDDLDELNLTAMVGTGASGVVLMGKLATVPVAVKLMELPEGAFSDGGGNMTTSTPVGGDDGAGGITDGGKGGEQPAPTRQKRRVEARRTLLRSATELAVLRSVSHINIVQVYAVYNNVFLNRVINGQRDVSYKLSYRRLGEAHNVQDPNECPPCVAVCMELADCGSLEGVLTQRTFPRWYSRKAGSMSNEGIMMLDLEVKAARIRQYGNMAGDVERLQET
ncbi:hypothetical protein Vafri_16524 [Volvox africanus]|uniref:Protein kinase domain-containing protein n=1 Tax=Volvox africanus TaxID=51714 RepID=A0A8J4F5T8_9CHLO|nr:hypothetical protein Vafri_16524 [Volvox africanus]